MANNIGWGKGASNNSIGWGNVGTNGFGSIYNTSNSGETDLAGVIRPSATFKQRVLDDAGTFEAQQCLDDLINQGLFENSNFVLTPNGFKAGKLYALKPESGDLDVSWARNGNATRVNKDGLIETVGVNVPRLDYTNGDCPSLLVEEQETNIVLNSDPIPSELRLTLNLNQQPNDFGIGNLFQNKYILDNENQTIEARIGIDMQSVPANTHVYCLLFARNQDGTEVMPSEDFYFQVTGGSVASDPSFYEKINIKEDVWLIKSIIPISRQSDTNSVLFRKTASESSKITEIAGFMATTINPCLSYIPTNGSAVTRPADAPQTITPPIGTTEIVEVFEDGTTNTITPIPLTYTIPFGRFKYILFN